MIDISSKAFRHLGKIKKREQLGAGSRRALSAMGRTSVILACAMGSLPMELKKSAAIRQRAQ